MAKRAGTKGTITKNAKGKNHNEDSESKINFKFQFSSLRTSSEESRRLSQCDCDIFADRTLNGQIAKKQEGRSSPEGKR